MPGGFGRGRPPVGGGRPGAGQHGGWPVGGRRGGGRPAGNRPFQRQEDDPPGTSRLFIAVPLPDEVRDAVGALMELVAGGPVDERLPGGLRWVRVEGLHLTLRFLGATPDVRLQEVSRAVASAARGIPPFGVSLQGGGAFPNPSHPRVLWLGIVEGAIELAALAGRIDGEVQRLGWPAEERPFRPHLTLARADGVPGAHDAAARLTEAAEPLRLGWRAARLVLYRSLLGRGPARYEALAEAALEAPAG